jgi:hypothetical protein
MTIILFYDSFPSHVSVSLYVFVPYNYIRSVYKFRNQAFEFAKRNHIHVILVAHIPKTEHCRPKKYWNIWFVLQFEGYVPHFAFLKIDFWFHSRNCLRNVRKRFTWSFQLSDIDFGKDEELSGTAIASTLEGMRPLDWDPVTVQLLRNASTQHGPETQDL